MLYLLKADLIAGLAIWANCKEICIREVFIKLYVNLLLLFEDKKRWNILAICTDSLDQCKLLSVS